MRLAGRVAGVGVEELSRECNNIVVPSTGDEESLVIDLCDVSFVDDAGVALFGELVAKRVRLVNGSPFVLEQLREAVEDDAQ